MIGFQVLAKNVENVFWDTVYIFKTCNAYRKVSALVT